MRILCCLDGTNIEQISTAIKMLVHDNTATIGLLYVTDEAPHMGMQRTRERFLRPSGPLSHRQEQMREAEQGTAQDILNEGARYFSGTELIHRAGRPEREIVNYAAEWSADIIIICSHTHYDGRTEIGPKSVGHTARFVLDHAPCPVLLTRPINKAQFPLKK